MTKTLADMTAEVREVNVEKGWRTGDNTFGDYVALLHSEISEALEAYRDHRLEDATEVMYSRQIPKPEGVGSELADVLIRVLDMCDMFGIQPAPLGRPSLSHVPPAEPPSHARTFGDHVAWMHARAAQMVGPGHPADDESRAHALFRADRMLRALLAVCHVYNIDLAAEYERKLAYNRTRPYQHGGRTLSEYSDTRQPQEHDHSVRLDGLGCPVCGYVTSMVPAGQDRHA